MRNNKLAYLTVGEHFVKTLSNFSDTWLTVAAHNRRLDKGWKVFKSRTH
jgi:hypothetical protein